MTSTATNDLQIVTGEYQIDPAHSRQSFGPGPGACVGESLA